VLGLFVFLFVSAAVFALPSFSDRNIAAGNLDPSDRIEVQEVRVTGDSSNTVTITSVTVQNLGTAGAGQIDRIEIFDGAALLGDTTNLAGLSTGITITLTGYAVPAGTIHDIRVYVTVGGAAVGGETVLLRLKFYYQMGASSYQSAWISDLTGETIYKGGFESLTDNALDPTFFDPEDQGLVQDCAFTDNDANGNNVLWTQTGSNKILSVENLGTGTTSDIWKIKVILRISGVDYTTWVSGSDWVVWAPASPMPLKWDQFKDVATHGAALPESIPDNSTMTAKVWMQANNSGAITDGRTIRPRVVAFVSEGGVSYEQSVTSGTTQTVRKAGFEQIAEQSAHVASGTKSSADPALEQVITVTDKDVNANAVRALSVNVRNAGTAAGSELSSIKVMSGTTTLKTVNTPADLANFKTGMEIVFTTLPPDVADEGSLTLKIYYAVGTPVDGHTLQPVVQVKSHEPPAGTVDYWTSEASYPDVIVLYSPGFEIVENVTPPEGGTAYSAQRLLAQLVRVLDKDENTDNVVIDPVVVKNLGTALENPDVVKIEVMRRNTADGPDLPMGSTTSLAGFRTAGITIATLTNNVVVDSAAGSEAFIAIYVTIGDPEQMVAGRTIQLETRVLHAETGRSFDKKVVSNQWTLETNHRPVVDFTYTPATPTYADTLAFTATVTDEDGDAITAYAWTFGDTGTATGQTPTHRYGQGGTFQVTVTAADARGVSGSKTKTVTVSGAPNALPTVTFDWTPAAPGVGDSTTFTATITDPDQPAGTAFTYLWDFGDGTTSTLSNPSHSFAEKKSYTITLKVTDAASGETTVTRTLSIGNAPPVANFQASKQTVAVGEPVQLTDASTDTDGTVTGWAWTFGDGATSTAKNPSHTYSAMGSFTVTLVVTDDKGGESAPKTLVITVTGPTGIVTHSYPNPAKDHATLFFYVPEGATDLVVRIYDVAGRLVHEENLPAGDSTYVWDLRSDDGADLPTGLYFYVIAGKDATGKVIKSPIFKLLIAR
jgi:PKD repeat protein